MPGMSPALSTSTMNLLGTVLPKPVVLRDTEDGENLAASADPVAARRGSKSEPSVGAIVHKVKHKHTPEYTYVR